MKLVLVYRCYGHFTTKKVDECGIKREACGVDAITYADGSIELAGILDDQPGNVESFITADAAASAKAVRRYFAVRPESVRYAELVPPSKQFDVLQWDGAKEMSREEKDAIADTKMFNELLAAQDLERDQARVQEPEEEHFHD